MAWATVGLPAGGVAKLNDLDPFHPELVLHHYQCALETLEGVARSQYLAFRADVVLDLLADNLIKLTHSLQNY